MSFVYISVYVLHNSHHLSKKIREEIKFTKLMFACKMLYNALNYNKINCLSFSVYYFRNWHPNPHSTSVKFEIHFCGSSQIQDVHLGITLRLLSFRSVITRLMLIKKNFIKYILQRYRRLLDKIAMDRFTNNVDKYNKLIYALKAIIAYPAYNRCQSHSTSSRLINKWLPYSCEIC